MKKSLYLTTISLILLSYSLSAQKNKDKDVIKLISCEDQGIIRQADSLKTLLADSGFVVMRQAMVNMESEYELPVIVPLNAGTWYKIIFIGDIRSRLYELRVYDYEENQVIYKKHLWGDVDGNAINVSYIPRTTEFHMIKPLQVNKVQKKNLCGLVMLMRKTN